MQRYQRHKETVLLMHPGIFAHHIFNKTSKIDHYSHINKGYTQTVPFQGSNSHPQLLYIAHSV